jgi:hypothetical protein
VYFLVFYKQRVPTIARAEFAGPVVAHDQDVPE